MVLHSTAWEECDQGQLYNAHCQWCVVYNPHTHRQDEKPHRTCSWNLGSRYDCYACDRDLCSVEDYSLQEETFAQWRIIPLKNWDHANTYRGVADPNRESIEGKNLFSSWPSFRFDQYYQILTQCIVRQKCLMKRLLVGWGLFSKLVGLAEKMFPGRIALRTRLPRYRM
jgi:hypothetical protein